MGLLQKIALSINAFNKTHRFPPNFLIVNHFAARLAIIEAQSTKGILIKNNDGSSLLYGMLLIENDKLKNNDLILLTDHVDLEDAINELYKQ